MSSPKLEEALQYFVPKLPSRKRAQVLEELRAILEKYKSFSSKKYIVLEPHQMIDESDEEHEARVAEILNAPHSRGRPPYTAQKLLVIDLKDLLGKHGCRFGVYKNRETAPLVKLADTIDLVAGKPMGDVSWQSIAEECADALFAIELLLGQPLASDPEERKLARKIFRDAQRKTFKQRP